MGTEEMTIREIKKREMGPNPKQKIQKLKKDQTRYPKAKGPKAQS
ncbi:hypothetical protein CCACVL1_07504 [Corchorus capsularis]|uniref:Uncharacterized protein n=1 Tax=Corchorus capsularis TaxID=210143 RepID=A0A1R3J5R3_COCAP|nr:hypothetical protein CCACVL1_07504 [Corchorus capsularis]